MKAAQIKCSLCGKTYFRDKKRFNEAIKKGWKQYCSPKCNSRSKERQITLKCHNPECRKLFKRQIHDYDPSKPAFCTSSCAAIINNSLHPKRKPITKICPTCGDIFTGQNKFCSKKCLPPSNFSKRLVSKNQILLEIKDFYNKNNRIPVKREYPHYKAARLRFGNWNNAIKAAGFKSNPVMFAYKHIAFDGHKCDSFAEFVIDNWLYQNNIPHQIHVPYKNSPYYSDFLIIDTIIEFVGLEGVVIKYDKSLKEKRKLIKKQRLNVIEIYPQDLFPKNTLNIKLSVLQNGKI